MARRKAFTHRVDAYAAGVTDGTIPAGPLVRLACRRHLADRAQAKIKGFTFDEAAANHTLDFIEKYLRLPDTDDGTGQPKPFKLEAWQAFIVGSLFGWRWTASGHRRFRNAFIEVGKGNGKTPMLAAIGLYGLMADGQRAPEIYAAAADRDQAEIMYRDAVRMVNASPDLSSRITQSGIQHVHNMVYGLGFFRPFSREQGSKSGTRPHMGLIDEVHEHPSPETINKLRAGAKGNMNALFAEITNSGFDRTSICWEHHEHSRRILEGLVEDDRWFTYVCALDLNEDPLTDEGCWTKTNPNLGVSIHPEYLRDQVSAAKHLPIERNTVLRLNFCVWTNAQAASPFERAKWDACRPVSDAELVGRPCFGGLDLGQSDDFTAWVRLWLLADGRIGVRCRYWLPRIALEKYPDRPYAVWERAKLLTVTEGDTTDLPAVESVIAADCRASGVRELAFDKRFAEHMMLNLRGKGILTVDCPQGFGLNEAILKVEEWVIRGLLGHNGDPILGWMSDNVVVITGSRDGDVRLDKSHAKDKIDGIAALVMAASRLMVYKPASYSFTVIGSGR